MSSSRRYPCQFSAGKATPTWPIVSGWPRCMRMGGARDSCHRRTFVAYRARHILHRPPIDHQYFDPRRPHHLTGTQPVPHPWPPLHRYGVNPLRYLLPQSQQSQLIVPNTDGVSPATDTRSDSLPTSMSAKCSSRSATLAPRTLPMWKNAWPQGYRGDKHAQRYPRRVKPSHIWRT